MTTTDLLKSTKENIFNNKLSRYLLISLGVLIPIIISLSENKINPEKSVLLVRLVLSLMIYWLMVIPSVIKLYRISRFLLRIAIVAGILIPIILTLKYEKLEILEKNYPKVKVLNSKEVESGTDWNYILAETKIKKYSQPKTQSYAFVSGAKQIDVFVYFSGLTWLAILILIWIYEGYLLSEGRKKTPL